jgi:hypothetical protein
MNPSFKRENRKREREREREEITTMLEAFTIKLLPFKGTVS